MEEHVLALQIPIFVIVLLHIPVQHVQLSIFVVLVHVKMAEHVQMV